MNLERALIIAMLSYYEKKTDAEDRRPPKGRVTVAGVKVLLFPSHISPSHMFILLAAPRAAPPQFKSPIRLLLYHRRKR